jgi:hypothetical protein
MANGVEIKAAYDSLREVCYATSLMLSELRRELDYKAQLTQKNSTIMPWKSALFDQPRMWLPYHQQLLFCEKRSNRWASEAIGIDVYFDDGYHARQTLKYPVVFCGVLRGIAAQNPIPSFNFYELCANAHKNICHEAPFYSAGFKKTQDCTDAIGYYLALDRLEDRARLVALIVVPCLALLKYDVDAARTAIGSVALKVQDFVV